MNWFKYYQLYCGRKKPMLKANKKARAKLKNDLRKEFNANPNPRR